MSSATVMTSGFKRLNSHLQRVIGNKRRFDTLGMFLRLGASLTAYEETSWADVINDSGTLITARDFGTERDEKNRKLVCLDFDVPKSPVFGTSIWAS